MLVSGLLGLGLSVFGVVEFRVVGFQGFRFRVLGLRRIQGFGIGPKAYWRRFFITYKACSYIALSYELWSKLVRGGCIRGYIGDCRD